MSQAHDDASLEYETGYRESPRGRGSRDSTPAYKEVAISPLSIVGTQKVKPSRSAGLPKPIATVRNQYWYGIINTNVNLPGRIKEIREANLKDSKGGWKKNLHNLLQNTLQPGEHYQIYPSKEHAEEFVESREDPLDDEVIRSRAFLDSASLREPGDISTPGPTNKSVKEPSTRKLKVKSTKVAGSEMVTPLE